MTLLYVNAFHIAKVGDWVQRFKGRCEDNLHSGGVFLQGAGKNIFSR
jgi:hypothetical protein